MTQAETPIAQISFELQPTGAPAIADHGTMSGLGDDDHPQYLTGERAAAIFAQKTEVTAAVAALEAAADATSEGAAAAMAAHTGAPDPHPQYERTERKNQANGYAGLDGAGKVPSS